MIPKIDYHIHTPLCGHANGDLEKYVERAIEIGLEEIGFSDHAPLVSHDDPSVTMSYEQLPEYHKMIEALQEKFSPFSIKLGIEADFVPDCEQKTKEILEGYPYDYVIGSIHYLQKWAFDSPHQQEWWDTKDVNEVYREYYKALRESAQSGLFDIIAHVDLVKKFGHRPTDDMSKEIRETAKTFKDAGVAIEINSSGLRKPVREIYPSISMLRMYFQAGVPIIFGSDSHEPDQVGCDFDKSLALAKEAGYKEYLVFAKRKVTGKLSL